MAESILVANSRWYRWLGLSAVIVGLDQITKWYVTELLTHGERIAVLPVFSWVRWHNDGAAFSILSGGDGWQRWFFICLAVVFTAFIVTELRRLVVTDRLMGVVYGLILGGALGMAVVGAVANSAELIAVAFMQLLYQGSPFARLAQPGTAMRFATFSAVVPMGV